MSPRVPFTTLLLLLIVPAISAAAQDYRGTLLTAAIDPGVYAQQINLRSLQEKVVDFSIREMPLLQALTLLSEKSELILAFSPTFIPEGSRVTCDCTGLTFEETLSRLLNQVSLSYRLVGEHILIEVASEPQALGSFNAPLASPHTSRPQNITLRNPAPSGVLLAAPPARRVGAITGRIIDQQTNQPIATAQVFIPSTNIGVLSSIDGSFRLVDVPDGSHTVNVQRIGYQTESQTITVVSGETHILNFGLIREALSLDEIVVTGTPGGTQRRAVGNLVARVNASEITEIAPVTSVQELITGREPGVRYNRTSGNVGGGSSIRIRGTSSISMGDQPLVYVDGVRVDAGSAGPSLGDGRNSNKLDDFSPSDIESIEIIKGPAAATLYGTEASAGVINIITKKGASGAPQFDLSVRQGTNFMIDPAGKVGDLWGKNAAGEIYSINLYEADLADGLPPAFNKGRIQTYSLNMRGGTDLVRYFLSTEWDDQVGIVKHNWNDRLSMRANITVIPHESLTLDVSTGFVDGKTRYYQARTGYGEWDQFMWGNPGTRDQPIRGYYFAPPEELSNLEYTRDYQRFTSSATVTHNWRGLTQRVVVGLDLPDEDNLQLTPRHPLGEAHFFGESSLGRINLEQVTDRVTTLDYSTSLKYGLFEGVGFTTSVGLQYYAKKTHTFRGTGRDFPAPPIRTLAGAAETTSTELFSENKSVGTYIQQELSFHDRIYLTAAVRGDNNSAFGTDFNAAIYPKFSAAWVISDEPFWQLGNIINSFRLRSAWGKAGRQPDTFAAMTLYQPAVAAGSGPGVAPGVLGNPDLGPEVSTELELGFDVASFNGRLSSEFTYYTQKVVDALVSNPLPSSAGFPGSQSINLGRLSNWGWEVTVDGRVIERPNYGLDIGLGASRNQNRIDDLGGRQETATLRAGFPYPAETTRIMTSAEWSAGPGSRPINVMCDGGTEDYRPGGSPVPCSQAPDLLIGTNRPLYDFNFTTSLRLFQNLRFFGMIEMSKDFWGSSYHIQQRHVVHCTAEKCIRADDPMYMAANRWGMGDSSGLQNLTYDAGFAKIREVSANYNLPIFLTDRLGASRASLSIAGRDLWTIWRAQKDIEGVRIPDPELQTYSGSTSIYPSPPMASISATLRLSF